MFLVSFTFFRPLDSAEPGVFLSLATAAAVVVLVVASARRLVNISSNRRCRGWQSGSVSVINVAITIFSNCSSAYVYSYLSYDASVLILW